MSSAAPGLRSTAAARLRAGQRRIVARWVERLREELPAAKGERRPILVDTVPSYLQHLAESLARGGSSGDGAESSTVPEEHGAERARLARFRPDEVVREYQILRDVILETLSEEG